MSTEDITQVNPVLEVTDSEEGASTPNEEGGVRTEGYTVPTLEDVKREEGVGSWLRRMPRNVQGTLVVLAVAGVATAVLTASPDGGNKDSDEDISGRQAPELFLGPDLEPEAGPPADDRSGQEIPEIPQDMAPNPERSDMDGWLALWSAEAAEVDGINGERSHGSTSEWTGNITGNLRLRLNDVKNPESGQGVPYSSEMRNLSGIVFVLENGGEYIPVENPIVYGILPTNEAETAWSWAWRADSTSPVFDDYYVMYNDHEGNLQGFAVVDGVAQWPTNNNTTVAAVFTDIRGVGITQGQVSRDSLLDTDEGFVIESSNGYGNITIPDQASAFSSMEEVWDVLTQYRNLQPSSTSEVMSRISAL